MIIIESDIKSTKYPDLPNGEKSLVYNGNHFLVYICGGDPYDRSVDSNKNPDIVVGISAVDDSDHIAEKYFFSDSYDKAISLYKKLLRSSGIIGFYGAIDKFDLEELD